jgi:diguanylate cyclase (GGDEF)-like protein
MASSVRLHKIKSLYIELGFVAALSVILLAIATIFVLGILQARDEALANARLSARNVEQLIANSSLHVLNSFDMSIEQVVKSLGSIEGQNVPDELKRQILFDNSANSKYFYSIRVLDEKGDLILDSRELKPARLNFAEHDYFQLHVPQGGPNLFVSQPYLARSDGDYAVALSRRLEDADGNFKGVVMGGVSIAFFNELLKSSELGSGAVEAIVRSDGTIISRRPFDRFATGTRIAGPLMESYSASRSGSYEGTSTVDRIERLYSYAQIGNYPLIALVGLSKRTVLSDWRDRAFITSILMVVLMGVVVGLTVKLSNQLKIQVRLRRDLETANDALLKLSRSDKLTSLGNRRFFDEMLEKEWLRHHRMTSELSLLMIDVDHFKSFNDLFGHGAGDEVLARIALCIEIAIRRPGDIACRYGGEEFAVILPDTSKSGATAIARQILDRIADEKIVHPMGDAGYLSASVGVAAMTPRSAVFGMNSLLIEADKALYRAKDRGRNRVEVISLEKPLRIAS